MHKRRAHNFTTAVPEETQAPRLLGPTGGSPSHPSRELHLIKSLLFVVILVTTLPSAQAAVTNTFTNGQVTVDFNDNMTSTVFRNGGTAAQDQLYLERFALNYSTNGGNSYVFRGANDWTLGFPGTSWYGISEVTPSYMLTDSAGNAKVVRADLKTDDSNIAINVSAALKDINTASYRWLILTYIFNNTNPATTLTNVRFFFGSDFDSGGDSGDDRSQYIAAYTLLYTRDRNANQVHNGFSSTVLPSAYFIYTWNDDWSEVVSNSPTSTALDTDSALTGRDDWYIAYRWSLGSLSPGDLKRIPIVYARGVDLADIEAQITNAVAEMANTNIVLSPLAQTVDVFVNSTASSTVSVDNTQPLMDYANLTVLGIYASDGKEVNWDYNLSESLLFLNPYTNYNTSLTRNITLNVSVPWNASAGLYNVTLLGQSIFNSSKYSIINVTLNVSDNIPPQISFVPPTPENSSTVRTDYIFINITLSETGSTAILEWNGTNYTMSGGGINFYYNISLTSGGLYSYRIYASDTSNNWNSSGLRVVHVDFLPPDVSVIAPPNLSIVKGPEYINASISDDYTGVANTYVNISNSTNSFIYPMAIYQGDSLEGNWSYTWDTTSFSDGVYLLMVNATDYANNSNLSEYVTVTIDNYYPEASFVNPTPANGSVTENPWIFVNVSLNEPDIETAYLEWDNTSKGGGVTNLSMVCTYENCYYNYTFDTTKAYAGNYSFRVWVKDSAGNWNSSELRAVTVKGRLLISSYSSLAPAIITSPSFNTTMLKFNLSALGENSSLTSITLKKTGNFPYNLVNVSLYWDRLGDTTTSYNTSLQSDDVLLARGSFDSSGIAILSLSFSVNASEEETLVVVYDIGKL